MTHSSKPSDKVDLIFDWPCILLMLVLAKRKKLKLLEDQVPRLHCCGQIFTRATRLQSTGQILFQIAVLFAVQKLACFCGRGQQAQPYIAWINQYY